MALEEIIANHASIDVDLGAGKQVFPAKSVAEKWSAYDWIYWRLRAMSEERQRAVVRELCKRYGFDLKSHCRSTIMNWKDIRNLARDPLVTIGAHTAGHFALAKLSMARARN